jgi:hypothetical protein
MLLVCLNYDDNMFMLVLHICSPCDIINKHLFELKIIIQTKKTTTSARLVVF